MENILRNSSLFRQQAYINGQWCDAENGKVLEVYNPYDQSLLGTVPYMGEKDTQRAIEAAEAALPAWRGKSAKERAQLLRCWHGAVMEHQDDLARLMVLEQGKPLAEAKGEIAYAASFIEWFAEEGKRVYGDIIPSADVDKQILVYKEPVGVAAAITPWNFPSAMITRKVAPALAAGCTQIVKPASATPFSALALAYLAEQSGIPAGVLNVVVGDTQAISTTLTGSEAVRKLSFTGSTETGRVLMEACALTLKKLSLELGGNAPFIVTEDADIEAAVKGGMASKFRNSGQTCICANRFLVQEAVVGQFTDAMVREVEQLVVGNGLREGVTQGPLINAGGVEKVEALLQDAVERGATVITGGLRSSAGATCFQPTVITGVTDAMAITREEIFGPVVAISSYAAEEEAVKRANATPYGLAAYLYARDVGAVMRITGQLAYGMVGVNQGMISTEVAPFGGVKQSGFGREGAKYGIEEYVQTKYVALTY